ncbi:MAG: hypothetical protein QXN15_02835 [Candidatus Jordarchaeales archaeon]
MLKNLLFKLVGRASREQQDPRAFLRVIVEGLKGVVDFYGAGFESNVIKYALRGTAKLCGEEPPSGIKTLDQLEEYLASKMDKINAPYLLIWAMFVVSKKFEGYQGLSEVILERSILKFARKNYGGELKRGDIKAAVSKAYSDLVSMRTAPLEVRYRKKNGDVLLLIKNCFLFDGCRISKQSGLSERADGTIVCGIASFICHYISEATGNEWHYAIVKFEGRECIAHCSPILT